MRDKILGCWLGKTIGGTLGMPFEGQDGPHNVNFYDPVPTEMIANDDLDLQVLWACILNEMETPRVDRHILGKAWGEHVEFPWDEYGVAIRNLRLGLRPPLTGSYDNYFTNGMGAAIRSELWACLAPGDPQLAAEYAYEDACVDHAGEGIWAPVFLAALESLAFVESDIDRLLEQALSQLPPDSLVRLAVSDTKRWFEKGGEWLSVRKQILDKYGHENFTDVTMNMAFIVLAWLASKGDFSNSIRIATNCGKDTDCTAATVGALMGILNPNGIDPKWLKPIGRDLVVSPEIIGINPPGTLDEFTEMVLSLKERLGSTHTDSIDLAQSAMELSAPVEMAFTSASGLKDMRNANKITFPENFVRTEFPGVLNSLPISDFSNEVLLLRYKLRLPDKRGIRLVFNTPQSNDVWLNGKHLFHRDGGRMAPSPHRAPDNQFADITLDAGEHEVVASIKRPCDTDHATWIIIAADPKTLQWIPKAFLRTNN